MGVSSATGPTPNKGYEAAAMQGVGVVLNKLAELLPTVGPASEIGKEIMNAMKALSKVVQPGQVSNAAQKNTIDQMAMKIAQNQQTMKSMQPGAPGGGQPEAMAAP